MVVVDGSVKEAFKVSLRDRVPQRSVGQVSLTFQVRVVEVFTDLFSAASSSHSSGAADEVFTWFFSSHFSPTSKKCAVGTHSGSRLGADFAPWTRTAHHDEEDELEPAATRFCSRFSALAGLHAVPGAAAGSARTGVCLW